MATSLRHFLRRASDFPARSRRNGGRTPNQFTSSTSVTYGNRATAKPESDFQNQTLSLPQEPTAASGAEDPLVHPDFFDVNALTSVRQLFEARVHLGHKTGTWNPRMKPYLFGSRAGLHIIDLDKTLCHLRRALNVAGHVAYRNGIILFVNERSQFERVVQKAARDCGEYFVAQRWIAGTLTNSYMLLGTLRLPDLIIFLSVPPSQTAIREAVMSNIPSIGVVDSDCNPNLISYPIPGNDDTPTAVQLYLSLFSEVISRAKAKRREGEASLAQVAGDGMAEENRS